MIIYRDKENNFIELFNERNGTLFRSSVIGQKDDPIARDFPELIDIGIMGHCHSSEKCLCNEYGVDCYQKGSILTRPNMTFDDYCYIINQCKHKTFQVALGGAGDPNKHEQFEDILLFTRQNMIVPNLTTSGFNLNEHEIELISRNCGAVAVSWYSKLSHSKNELCPITIESIQNLVEKDCIVNVHHVVSNDSIDEIIYRLENDIYPKGISAVVFLLYKPVGLANTSKMISSQDPRIKEFIGLCTEKKHPYKVGFDTCFTPALIDCFNTISEQSVDTCEAARFSMYIDSELRCFPCSFGIDCIDNPQSLKNSSIKEVWDSSYFKSFRNIPAKHKCLNCQKSDVCRHGCILNLGIELCENSIM